MQKNLDNLFAQLNEIHNGNAVIRHVRKDRQEVSGSFSVQPASRPGSEQKEETPRQKGS